MSVVGEFFRLSVDDERLELPLHCCVNGCVYEKLVGIHGWY